MTTTTLDALRQVNQLLHDAGWDLPAPQPPELTEEALRSIRHAYRNLLREDHFRIIQQTLGLGQRVEEAGQQLGLDRQQAVSLFHEAMTRLAGFAEVVEEQGFAPEIPTVVAAS